jgi:hypothetical protein
MSMSKEGAKRVKEEDDVKFPSSTQKVCCVSAKKLFFRRFKKSPFFSTISVHLRLYLPLSLSVLSPC